MAELDIRSDTGDTLGSGTKPSILNRAHLAEVSKAPAKVRMETTKQSVAAQT
jgi:hypothetical protein